MQKTWEEYEEEKENKDYTGYRAEFKGDHDGKLASKVIGDAERPEDWDGCSFVVVEDMESDIIIGFYECDNDKRLGDKQFYVEKDDMWFEG